MQSANDLEPLPIDFPVCEESESSCGESTEAEDSRHGGYHPARVGEAFKSGRYRALCRLGSGHFSTVWLCFDSAKSRFPSEPLYPVENVPGVTANGNGETPVLETRNHVGGDAHARAPRGKVVALKIQKSAPGYTDAAQDEIRILESIRNADPSRTQPVVTLLDHFEHIGVNGRHVCLVFDVMGGSLLHLIKRFNFQGIPPELVKRLTHDILVGLDFLHSQASIIHTDLKPENILMRLPPSMLRELDVRGYEFNRELVNRKLGRSNGSNSRSVVSPRDNVMNSSTLRETKAQRKRRRRRMKAQAARVVMPSERAATSWQEVPVPTTPLKDEPVGSEAEAHVRISRNNLSEKGDLWMAPEMPGPNGSERNIIPDDVQMQLPHRGPRDVNLSEPEFNLKELIDVDRVFAAGRVAIVDLGNACWIDHQFTGDIQTRQYRSPEVIIGAPYGTAADMFSVACLVFELLTGEYLFDPHSAPDYNRDEDHLAQMMELLGPMPRYLTNRGRYARDFFTRNGELRNVMYLRDYPLHMVLIHRFRYPPELADEIASFLLPMLEFDPQKRATAQDCLRHPFLTLQQ